MRKLTLAAAWVGGIVIFLTAAAYAVLGRDFLRPLLRLRARAATRLETALTPPTPGEIAAARAQAAAADTASAQLNARTDAAPPEFILAFLAAILLAAFAAFYITGRRRRASR